MVALHDAILAAMESYAANGGQTDEVASSKLDPDNWEADVEDAVQSLQLAILGRPNAGKSTLVNHLLGEERQITGPEPGLTRDAIGTA